MRFQSLASWRGCVCRCCCCCCCVASAKTIQIIFRFSSPLSHSLSLCFWHWFTFMSVKWPTGARQMKSVFDVRVRNGPNRLDYLARARARVFGSRSDHLDHLTGVCYGLYYCLWWLSAALDQNSLYSPVQFSSVGFGSMRSPICRPLFSHFDSNFFSAKCDYKMHKQSTNQFHGRKILYICT